MSRFQVESVSVFNQSKEHSSWRVDHQIIQRHFRRVDPILAKVIKQVGPVTLKPERDRFKMLVRSILSQQISVGAARAIRLRLESNLQPGGIRPEAIASLTVDQLRAIGVSRQKAGYLLDLAGKCADGTVQLARLGANGRRAGDRGTDQGARSWALDGPHVLDFCSRSARRFSGGRLRRPFGNPATVCVGRPVRQRRLSRNRESLAALCEHRELVLLAILGSQSKSSNQEEDRKGVRRTNSVWVARLISFSAEVTNPTASEHKRNRADQAEFKQNQCRRLGNGRYGNQCNE